MGIEAKAEKQEYKPNRAVRRAFARLEAHKASLRRRKLHLPKSGRLRCSRCHNGFIGATRCQCKAMTGVFR